MKHKLCALVSAVILCALCVAPAHALEYSFDAPADYLFGWPTSDDTPHEWQDPNVDLSKSTALIPPGFGTPTSYLPGSGEYLTPNLVPGALGSGLVNQEGGPTGGGYPTVGAGITTVDSPSFPTVDIPSGGQTVGFTEVTSAMYYSNGSLGTLKIPSIGLTVGIYEGTGSAPLLKGAGHFTGTSIWDGNCCIAGHNRGVRNDFGKIHLLKSGAVITLTTKLGARTYTVSSVTKVSVNDVSGLEPSDTNMITLYTCVENQPAYRWCVRGIAY